jgi:hypothetical protein
MENVVVLTAAGCSVGAGGRLMTGPAGSNLECLVLDAVEECPISGDARALISWKRKNDFGKGNFEDWLSYLYQCLWNHKIRPFADKGCDVEGRSSHYRRRHEGPGAFGSRRRGTARLYIEQAIFAECALELDRKEVTGGTCWEEGARGIHHPNIDFLDTTLEGSCASHAGREERYKPLPEIQLDQVK